MTRIRMRYYSKPDEFWHRVFFSRTTHLFFDDRIVQGGATAAGRDYCTNLHYFPGKFRLS